MHPDQGAAAFGGSLSSDAACQGLWPCGREDFVRPAGRGAALARRGEASQRRGGFSVQEEQGHGDLGRGRHRRARQDHGEEVSGRGAKGRVRRGHLPGKTHHHCDRRAAARAAGARARQETGVDLFRGDGAGQDAEVVARRRLRRDRHRVRLVLPHHGRGSDRRRSTAADLAGGGCRNIQICPQGVREAGNRRYSPIPK